MKNHCRNIGTQVYASVWLNGFGGSVAVGWVEETGAGNGCILSCLIQGQIVMILNKALDTVLGYITSME